jgi:ABC-type sugar transport system permease subunit
MNVLPALIRRSPQLFYGAGVVMFVWYLGNSYAELTILNAQQVGLEGYSALVKSKALFEALRESLYYVSSGVMFQILIAIYDKVKGE